MERLKEKIGELTYHPEPDVDYYARAHGEAVWLAGVASWAGAAGKGHVQLGLN